MCGGARDAWFVCLFVLPTVSSFDLPTLPPSLSQHNTQEARPLPPPPCIRVRHKQERTSPSLPHHRLQAPLLLPLISHGVGRKGEELDQVHCQAPRPNSYRLLLLCLVHEAVESTRPPARLLPPGCLVDQIPEPGPLLCACETLPARPPLVREVGHRHRCHCWDWRGLCL